MKSFLKRSIFVVMVLSASIVLISNSAMAAIEKPYFSFTGSFVYDVDNSMLTTNVLGISSIYYSDGTATSDSGVDPLVGGTFTLGNPNGSSGEIFNGGESSMVFGSSVGGTGNMAFSLDNGATNYMTATLSDFIVVDNIFGVRTNPLFDLDNLVSIDPNASVTNSKFLNEVKAMSNPVGNLQLYFAPAGGEDFTEDSAGSFSGQLSMVSIVPEPVSSILFLTGGATLAFRRYRRKIN